MFSSKDFEKCWFLYQSEGLPHNLSIGEFCLKQGVPVNEFNKWYRDTMERDEMIRYIEFLHERLDEEKRARELSDKRFDEESAARKEADKRVFDLLGKIDRMGEQHQEELQKLQKTIEDLTSAVRLNKKNRFAATSQKTRHSSQKNESPTREEECENHDGTRNF